MIAHKYCSNRRHVNDTNKPWVFQRIEKWMQLIDFSSTYKANSRADFLVRLFFYFVSAVFGLAILAINLNRNRENAAESFGQFIMWATCLSQIYVFFKSNDRNKKLWKALIESWMKLENTETKNRITNEIENQIVIKSYIIQYLGLLLFVSYNFSPIFICSFYKTSNVLTCNLSTYAWLPYDINNLFLYAMAYSFVACVTAFAIFTCITAVTFYVAAMDVIAGHLKLLNESILIYQLSGRRHNVYWLGKGLKKCIKEHQLILRWCATFEGTINCLMLILFMIQSVFIIFTTLGDIVVPLYKLSYALAAVISPCYIFLYYNSAHNIIHEGLKLSDTVYFCGWEQVKHSKQLLCLTEIMVLRAQKPIYFTIGKCNALIFKHFLNVNLKFLTSWIIFTINNPFDD